MKIWLHIILQWEFFIGNPFPTGIISYVRSHGWFSDENIFICYTTYNFISTISYWTVVHHVRLKSAYLGTKLPKVFHTSEHDVNVISEITLQGVVMVTVWRKVACRRNIEEQKFLRMKIFVPHFTFELDYSFWESLDLRTVLITGGH